MAEKKLSQFRISNETYDIYDKEAQDCLTDTDLINGNLDLDGDITIDGTLNVSDMTTHNNHILLVNSDMDRDGEIPSSEQDRFIAFRDKDDETIALLRGVIGNTPAGNMGVQLIGYGEDSEGTTVTNRLGIYVNREGKCVYMLSDPDAFQKALKIRTGSTSNPTLTSVAAGSTSAKHITFTPRLSAKPNVICSLLSKQTQLIGNCSVVVDPDSISETGFTATLVNSSSSARDLGFS